MSDDSDDLAGPGPSVRITMLGRFSVTLDGVVVGEQAWSRRSAAGVVKLLCLAPGRRIHRERLMDSLWPDTPLDIAGPRLHKAAHYARRALGNRPRALVLRNDMVTLLPEAQVVVDADIFRNEARRALADGGVGRVDGALAMYGGPLLPQDIYEPWAEAPRALLESLHGELLRQPSRRLAPGRHSPSDQQAPLVEAAGTRLIGRRDVGDLLHGEFARAHAREGSTVLVTGPPGVGKSSVLDLAVALAKQRAWKVGRGTASAVEDPWPYAPVLEALADLCRQHPSLMVLLDGRHRRDLESAMRAREQSWHQDSARQRLFLAAGELLRAAAAEGVLLVIDDAHEADQASLRLLHYLARCALGTRAVLALAHREDGDETLEKVRDSLVARGIARQIELSPLGEAATRRLLALRFPSLDDEAKGRIWTASGGLPFTALQLAKAAFEGRLEGHYHGLPHAVRRNLQRARLLGSSFTVDEFVAATGVDEGEAHRQLQVALSGLVLEPVSNSYRFRHHPHLREAPLRAIPMHVPGGAPPGTGERSPDAGPRQRVARPLGAERSLPHARKRRSRQMEAVNAQ